MCLCLQSFILSNVWSYMYMYVGMCIDSCCIKQSISMSFIICLNFFYFSYNLWINNVMTKGFNPNFIPPPTTHMYLCKNTLTFFLCQEKILYYQWSHTCSEWWKKHCKKIRSSVNHYFEMWTKDPQSNCCSPIQVCI